MWNRQQEADEALEVLERAGELGEALGEVAE
jgi:hypothetical protein